MSIDNEMDLRGKLGAALGEFEPGPFPHGAVVKQGRAVVLRRRLTVAVAAAAVVAAGAGVPAVLHALNQPAPSTARYHVTADPPGPGSVRGLVASGLVNRARWQLTVRYDTANQQLCIASIPRFSNCSAGPESSGMPPTGRDFASPGKLSGDPYEYARLPGGRGVRVQMFYGPVSSGVDRVLVQLSNGQVLALHPAAIFGSKYASWVAAAVPFPAAVRQITAYSGAKEVAYTVPFTGAGSIEIVRWLPPGRGALPTPLTVGLGAGHTAGKSWSARAHLGPWGICFTGVPVHMDLCRRATSFLRPGSLAVLVALAHQRPLSLAAVQVDRSVRYLVVTTASGATFRVTAVRVGSLLYGVVPSADHDPDVTWTAYDASGKRLGSGSARSW